MARTLLIPMREVVRAHLPTRPRSLRHNRFMGTVQALTENKRNVMSTNGRTIAVAVAVIVACWPQVGQAGEAFVTKVRGTSLTIDKGAEEGLEIGLAVTVVRSPEEAIIHPLTGENLGAPELELGSGEISKASARAASVRLANKPILPVRPGDVVRYITLDEQMVMEQEMVTVTAEKAAAERGKIRSEASRLARNIGGIQSTIKALERSIKELRRFDNDVVKPQFNSINREMETIQEELKELRESVTLMGSLPLGGLTEGEGLEGELSEAQVEKLQQLIDEKLAQLQGQMASVVAPSEPPPLPGDELPIEPPLESEEPGGIPFWVYLAVIFVGILGVGFWLFQKMSAGDDDDEEDDEEDDEDDEDGDFDEEDEDDEDLEIEEEDDIVVEETQ